MTRGAPLARRLLDKYLGSAFLAAVVIGSGSAAQQLSPDDTGLALLEKRRGDRGRAVRDHRHVRSGLRRTLQPGVPLVDEYFDGLTWRDALAYIPAQVVGCITGAITANLMFALSAISISTTHRATGAHLFAEVIATLGLLLVIFSLIRSGRAATARAAVGAYIGAAYWFTNSTSFANPAITVGRMCSGTFAGIAPASVPGSSPPSWSAAWSRSPPSGRSIPTSLLPRRPK